MTAMHVIGYVTGVLAAAMLLTNLVSYVGMHRLPHSALYRWVARPVYALAAVLSMLRLPFVVLPYVAKLLTFLALRRHFWRVWNSYPAQSLRLLGDALNVTVTWWLLTTTLYSPNTAVRVFLHAALLAECVRLLTEKGQMAISGLWQVLPHRRIARWLNGLPADLLPRYVAFYTLDDADRLDAALGMLRDGAAASPRLAARMRYVSAFRTVPASHSLRGGDVRDIARGEIYVHPGWVRDPWLLIGTALRRSPWVFDPRHVARPFRYRTHSNRLVTLTVFEGAYLSPPYAWFQFGHEIKAARYDLFYRMMRWLGWDAEGWVQADGTAQFDRTLHWLAARLGVLARQPQCCLWTDDEVAADIRKRGQPLPPADALARRYMYPEAYVEEVLLGKLHVEPVPQQAAISPQPRQHSPCGRVSRRPVRVMPDSF